MANAKLLPPLDVPAMMREAGLTALVVFGLSISMVGFHLYDVSGKLQLGYRLPSVVIITILGFAIRCLMILLRNHRPLPVIALGGLASLLLLLGLLSEPILGTDLTGYLPFGDAVVNWILALFLIGLTFSAVNKLRDHEVDEDRLDLGARVAKASIYIAPVLLAVAVLMPLLTYYPVSFLPKVDRRLLDIGVLVVTYIMLGWGLNIVVGLAGLLDLGYVAFYAVGAYSYALLATHFDLSFWICLPFAGMMSASFGILLGFPVLRLRGDYLAIVTLGFGEIIRVVLLNWYKFTNGPDGISGIPRPSFFGLEFKRRAAEGTETFHSFFDLTYSPVDRIVFLYYTILVMALLTNWFTLRIRKLPVGRAWEALREDEIACRSLGINPTNTKLTAFAIGAMFGGFAGSFFATRQGFISPESFTFIESAVILAIVVLGGMGSQIGVVFAAILLIGLPEFFRELQQYRMLAFGGAMVLIMLWRPAGLLAFRKPTILLHKTGGGGPS